MLAATSRQGWRQLSIFVCTLNGEWISQSAQRGRIACREADDQLSCRPEWTMVSRGRAGVE